MLGQRRFIPATICRSFVPLLFAVSAGSAQAVKQAPGVIWGYTDFIAGCPAGDTVIVGSNTRVAPHPSILRITVTYTGSDSIPRNGVPPESIWVDITAATGNLKVNDETKVGTAWRIFASDSTRGTGFTRIFVPSWSGCGTANLTLSVAGVGQGTRTATVRTVDSNADGRCDGDGADYLGACDLNYDGVVDSSDKNAVLNQSDHWRRNALHGTPVRRTNLLVHHPPNDTLTIGDGGMSWSPHGDSLSYSARLNDAFATCAIYIVPSSPRDGDKPRQFSFPPSDSMDYDPSWSPLGTSIVWDRADHVIYQKGVLVPGVNADTSTHAIYGSTTLPSTHTAVSPDGTTVAMSQQIGSDFHIVTMPIAGGAVKQITSGTNLNDFYPQWSPDGSHLVFERQDFSVSPPTHAIDTVAATGPPAQAGPLYQVPPAIAPNLVMPAFSGDGRVVVAGLQQSSTPYTLDANGTPVVPIQNYADFTAGASNLLSPRLSPDGTRLAMLALNPGDVPTDLTPNLWAVRRNMNLPPSISMVGGLSINRQAPYVDFTIGQDSTITLTVVRSDPEGDPLLDTGHFLRSDLGMSFSAATQTLTWPVGESPVGSYTVAFATSDSSGGTDAALARITVRDITKPAAVTSLSATCDPQVQNQWDLSWTATADDSNFSASGRAAQYNIRTSGAPITLENWSQATPIGGPTPGNPGNTDTWTVLVTGTTYLRMKVIDEVGNNSGLSNQLILHTVICGGSGLLAAGGGGSGGSGLQYQRSPGALSAQSTTTTWVGENSLLDGAASSMSASDLLDLAGISVNSGSYQVRMRETPGQDVSLDDARLLAVDHSPASHAFAAVGGVIVGQEVAPTAAVDGSGNDVLARVSGGSAQAFFADSGAVLTVQLGTDSTDAWAPVVIETSGESNPSTGILLEVPETPQGWRTVAHIHPREFFDSLAVDSVGASQVRLEFLSSHQVHFVGRVARTKETPTKQWAQLLSAQSSRLGDVKSSVFAADSASATLAGPDTLVMSFTAPTLAQGLVRDCFLAVDATPLSSRQAAMSAARPVAESVPARFALRQNQPNPFARTTALRFDLPIGAMVRFEVFDAGGRRVQTLANHYFPAGYHQVTWNPGQAAVRLGPGVYLYRIQAGAFRDQKKMVLLPGE